MRRIRENFLYEDESRVEESEGLRIAQCVIGEAVKVIQCMEVEAKTSHRHRILHITLVCDRGGLQPCYIVAAFLRKLKYVVALELIHSVRL